MKTKLTKEYLANSCLNMGAELSMENLCMAAFMNDADFREMVTRFFFDRAVAEAKAA